MRYKVSFRPEAEADLFGIYGYISERSGQTRAGDYIARIEAACMALATFPERGTKRDDLRQASAQLDLSVEQPSHFGSKRTLCVSYEYSTPVATSMPISLIWTYEDD
jgi:plasmid stabilization system protein ParE